MKMWLSCIFAAVMITVTSGHVCDPNPMFHDLANGCTIAGSIFSDKDAVMTDLTRICNRHDLCYKCGDTIPIPKLDCDTVMFQSFVEFCAKHKSAEDKAVDSLCLKLDFAMLKDITGQGEYVYGLTSFDCPADEGKKFGMQKNECNDGLLLELRHGCKEWMKANDPVQRSFCFQMTTNLMIALTVAGLKLFSNPYDMFCEQNKHVKKCIQTMEKKIIVHKDL